MLAQTTGNVPLAAAPVERTLNVPNAITVARFVLALGIFALMQRNTDWLLIAGLFVFSVLTDVLDGWIARKWNLITTFGRVVDPFVDKFITGGVFLFLLPIPNSGMNPWIAVTVIGREMLVTSLRGVLEQRGLDFSASASGKLKMFLQCAAATACLMSLEPGWGSWQLVGLPGAGAIPLTTIRDGLVWSMTAVTLYSGWIYIVRAVSLFRE